MSDTSTIYQPVAAPAVPARSFGLFSVAAPQPIGDMHELLGVRWESIACGATVGVTNDPCIVDMGETPDVDKDYTPGCGEWITAKPYAVYVNAQMSPGGRTEAEAQERTEALLTQAEQFGAEVGLWAAFVDALTITETGATDVEVLASVEAQLATDYFGQGVIHVPVAMAVRLGDHLQRQGTQLQTRIGTPVVVGAGYPDVDSIYGTGQIAIRRAAITTYPTVDRNINNLEALAERSYVVAWDCALVGATIAAAP